MYDALAAATSGTAAVKTSQLALPQAECEAVYSDAGYGDSTAKLARRSLATDGIFQDGYESQLVTIQGDPSTCYASQLVIGI